LSSGSDAVRHQLDGGIPREPVLEPHLVAHNLAQGRVQLFGDALGDARSGDAARLGVADEAAPARRGIELAAAHAQRDLRQLRRLARSGFATDDDHLVGFDRGPDLVALGADGQGFGEYDAQGQGRRGSQSP
jgi:hypothetical protein